MTAPDNLGAGSPAQVKALTQLAPSQIAAELSTTGFLLGQNVQIVSQYQQSLLTQTDSSPVGEAAGSGYQSGAFWGQVSGGFANRDSTGETDGYHQNFRGFAVSGDDHLSLDTTIGAALGWMQGRAYGFDSLAGSTLTTNSIPLTGYGTQQFGAAFVNRMAGIAYNLFDQSHYIGFLNENANANFHRNAARVA